MGKKRFLRPYLRMLKLVAATGDGKTELAAALASLKARKLILRCVGETNTTIRERTYAYTDNLKDTIVVAATLNEEIFSRGLYSDIFVTVWAKVARAQRKVVASIVGKDKEDFHNFLLKELDNPTNTRAVLSFLDTDTLNAFIQAVEQFYHDQKLMDYNYQIYNTARNSVAEAEAKDGTEKFLSIVKSEVERNLDLMPQEFKKAYWEIWEIANECLKKKFFEYFSIDDKSEDGYYYKEINLNNPDEQFLSAFFTANAVEAGEKLSIEVLCGEIVIYVPINDTIKKMIECNVRTNEIFRDSDGHILFGIMDTRGLYHAGSDDGANADYMEDMLYQNEADAILLVLPLAGDNNEKKARELYRKAFEGFGKQIPVFMIHNKLDIFVDQYGKENFDDKDPFSQDIREVTDITAKQYIDAIERKEIELHEELEAVQPKSRKGMKIKSLSCYLKRGTSFPQDLIAIYNPLNVFKAVFSDIADYLAKDGKKIPYTLREGFDEMHFSVKEEWFGQVMEKHLRSLETGKKVYNPGLEDLRKSIGITPHGNAYNALRRRLWNGDSYRSDIDESYFVNCKSFSVNFPANLRNFLTKDLCEQLVRTAIVLEGGYFKTQKDGERFEDMVLQYIDSRLLVRKLLYQKAIVNSERVSISFHERFKNFLNNSMDYFDQTQISQEDYLEAVKEIVFEAVEKTVRLNVTYR